MYVSSTIAACLEFQTRVPVPFIIHPNDTQLLSISCPWSPRTLYPLRSVLTPGFPSVSLTQIWPAPASTTWASPTDTIVKQQTKAGPSRPIGDWPSAINCLFT